MKVKSLFDKENQKRLQKQREKNLMIENLKGEYFGILKLGYFFPICFKKVHYSVVTLIMWFYFFPKFF